MDHHLTPATWMPLRLNSNVSLLSKEISSSKVLVDSSSLQCWVNRTFTAMVCICHYCSLADQLTLFAAYRHLKQTPLLGSFHGSNLLLNMFAVGGNLQDYLIWFVTNLDPNNANMGITWPKWTVESPLLLSFYDVLVAQNITEDTYRAEAIDTLNVFLLENTIWGIQ